MTDVVDEKQMPEMLVVDPIDLTLQATDEAAVISNQNDHVGDLPEISGLSKMNVGVDPTATPVKYHSSGSQGSNSRFRTQSTKLSAASRTATGLITKYVLADQRVVKYGLSLPIIFVFSMAIGVSYAMAYAANTGAGWIARDLTGVNEWTSHTRTHLTQDPAAVLDDLLSTATIGVDTSVSVNFVAKYGTASEANPLSTAATFNKTWLNPQFIMANGMTIVGQMAGAFEGYGAWPCAAYIAKHPIITTACPDVAKDWFTIQIYNNPVATSSEKASAYLSLTYTPMSLLSARIWNSQAPDLIDGGIIVRGLKEGTYTERIYSLLKLEQGKLALAKVEPCNRATQSNALECDHLENDDIYVRNYAQRDFKPMNKLDKIKFYGPALAPGNFVAADKNFVMLPAIATMMTNTGYAATTRFATTFPFRWTVKDEKMLGEWSLMQVASFTKAVGNGFATATAQMVVVCLIVFNAIAHCHTTKAVVAKEGKIYGFKNHLTMGIVARRLGTYKLVFVQLCIYHFLNVGKYFSAVFYHTQKTTDTIAFGAEGFLLVVVSSMLLDQLIFVERYSSVREYLSVIMSCGMYLVLMYLISTYFLWSSQVQVTELKICASANSCTVLHGYRYYYVGLAVCLIVPVFIINGPIHRFIIPTRSADPKSPASEDQLTSFEKFCVGRDARIEFGDYTREGNSTPISVVHAAGFTYIGPYLVRIKDFYMVVIGQLVPPFILESCGLTLTVFKMEKGRVVAGRHMVLAVAYKLFREAKHENYAPIP